MAKQFLIPHDGPGKKFVQALVEGLGVTDVCIGIDVYIRIDEVIRITVHTLARAEPDTVVDVTTLSSICREYAIEQ
jgi:hypothetical protein